MLIDDLARSFKQNVQVAKVVDEKGMDAPHLVLLPPLC